MRVGDQPVGQSAGRPLVRRVLFFAVVWWILLGGSMGGWLIGLVAIPGAAFASSLLGPSTPLRLRPGPILRFVLSFLIESLRSGADVARRALDPRLPLDPGFVDFSMRLRDDTSRVLLAATVTMLPGTITAKIRADSLVIHTVDTKMPVEARVRRTERLIAALFASTPRAGHA